jgi:hypothetical protein
LVNTAWSYVPCRSVPVLLHNPLAGNWHPFSSLSASAASDIQLSCYCSDAKQKWCFQTDGESHFLFLYSILCPSIHVEKEHNYISLSFFQIHLDHFNVATVEAEKMAARAEEKGGKEIEKDVSIVCNRSELRCPPPLFFAQNEGPPPSSESLSEKNAPKIA